MEWKGQPESSNVEDQRSPGGGFPTRGVAIGGGAGIGGLILFVVLALMGVDPTGLINPNQNNPQQNNPQQADGPAGVPNNGADDELRHFVGVVLRDTEDVWHEQFKKMGKEYREPKLHLFTGEVESACGQTSAAVGPFYCPGDEKVYLDLGFFQELKQDLKAPGEFAQAYVIAHEVGHHVQNLLGTTAKVDAQRRRLSEKDYDKLSVRLELQADFYAGVWAHDAQKMKHILQPGDIESALNAAHQIGDDYLQKRGRGYVTPDSFTHGTSEQRMRWFKKGFDTGDISQGDTFSKSDKDL